MIKNNKKTIITLAAYTVILLVVVAAFVVFVQMRNQSSVTKIYYATRDVESGTVVNTDFQTNYIAQVEVPTSVVKDLEKNGAKPIKSTIQIKSSALTFIPKGTYLSESMFGDIVTTTVMEEYAKTFVNPYYTVLKVSTENSPISGFSEGQKVSIEGTADLSLFSTEDELKSDAGEVYNGILSNKCVVHSLFYNEDLKLANIGVVVELADYPKINYFANYGELKFHEGVLSLWETTNLNVMTELWEKTGFKDSLAHELSSYAIYNDKEGNRIKKFLCYYSSTEYKETPKTYFFDLFADTADNIQAVSFYSPYQNVVISHYNLDGSDGAYMDLTGVNTDRDYNSKTGLFKYNFSDEGIYLIKFYQNIDFNYGTEDEPSWGEKYAIVNEVIFIIEKDTENQTWDTSNIKFNVGIKDTDSAFLGYEITGSVSKPYFDQLKNQTNIYLYALVQLNDALSKNIDEIDFFIDEEFEIGLFGQTAIKNVLFTDGIISFNLFKFKETAKYYKRPNKDQKLTICNYMGIPFKEDYKFFDEMSEETAEELIKELKGIIESSLDYKTISCVQYKYDTETKAFIEGEKENIPLILHLVASIWTNQLNINEYKDKEGNFYDLSVAFVLDDEEKIQTKINICPMVVENQSDVEEE